MEFQGRPGKSQKEGQEEQGELEELGEVAGLVGFSANARNPGCFILVQKVPGDFFPSWS